MPLGRHRGQAGEYVQDGPMPPFLRILSSTAVMMAFTAGCGETATTPTSRSLPAVFPVTITRTGGIAGFRDVLVVAGDGLVSVARKGHSQRRCQLTPSALDRLTKAATQLPWSEITQGGTNPAHPDDMVATVQSPLGGPVRLEDPLTGGGGKVFLELLGNLNNGPGSSRICAPV